MKPHTANLTPHPAPVAPLADQSGQGGRQTRLQMPCPSQVVLFDRTRTVHVVMQASRCEFCQQVAKVVMKQLKMT